MPLDAPTARLLPIFAIGLHASVARAAAPVPDELRPGRARVRLEVPRSGALLEGSRSAPDATTVLAGRLFYEDHRGMGAMSRRLDLDGRPGRVRKRRTNRRQDFLAADFMVVEVFEHDRRRSADGSCARWEYIGQATVGPDGRFSVPVPRRDPCQREADAPPDYRVQVSTRHCDPDICVELRRNWPSIYTIRFGDDHPLVLGADGAPLNTLLFTPEGRPSQNRHAFAANHFASLADALQTVHIEAQVPFRLEAFGPVQVHFPSVWSDGTSPAPDRIDINNNGWPKGNLVVHEYGHVLHRRLWGGDYAGYPVPVQSWNGVAHSGEAPFIALKEGWANFLTAYVAGRCDRPAFDARDDLASLERPLSGNHFPQNHRRVLCDFIDANEDQRPGTTVRDRMQLSLLEVWTLMDLTDDRVGTYPGHHPVHEGLDLCDVAEVYLQEHGRGPEPVRLLYGVLETNDLHCPRVTERFLALPPDPPTTAEPLPAPTP